MDYVRDYKSRIETIKSSIKRFSDEIKNLKQLLESSTEEEKEQFNGAIKEKEKIIEKLNRELYDNYINSIDRLKKYLIDGLDNYNLNDIEYDFKFVYGVEKDVSLPREFKDNIINYRNLNLSSDEINIIRNFLEKKKIKKIENSNSVNEIEDIYKKIISDVDSIVNMSNNFSNIYHNDADYIYYKEYVLKTFDSINKNMDMLPSSIKDELEKYPNYVNAKRICSEFEKKVDKPIDSGKKTIDDYIKERDALKDKIEKLENELQEYGNVYGPLPLAKHQRKIDAMKEKEEFEKELKNYNEIIDAYERIIKNYARLEKIAKQRINGNNEELDEEEQEILIEIANDRKKLPEDLLNSLKDYKQKKVEPKKEEIGASTKVGFKEKAKKVVKVTKDFIVKNKYTIIKFGIIALSAAVIINLMPSIMVFNAGLWHSAGVLQGPLHGANMAMGKIVQLLPGFGTHYFGGVGTHYFGGTVLNHMFAKTLVPAAIEAAGLVGILKVYKSACKEFIEYKKQIYNIKKRLKNENESNILDEAKNLKISIDKSYSDGKLTEKEYKVLLNKLKSIEKKMGVDLLDVINDEEKLKNNKLEHLEKMKKLAQQVQLGKLRPQDVNNSSSPYDKVEYSPYGKVDYNPYYTNYESRGRGR